MTAIDHNRLEREARKLCEQVRGPGAWDKPGCHKNHWRDRVASIAVIAERAPKVEQSAYDRVKDSLANIMGGRW